VADPLRTKQLRAGLTQGLMVVQRLEWIARPFRLKWLTTGKVTGTLNSCSLIAGALLLMAPFGLIPFSNNSKPWWDSVWIAGK
jgi:hypothetical protein